MVRYVLVKERTSIYININALNYKLDKEHEGISEGSGASHDPLASLEAREFGRAGVLKLLREPSDGGVLLVNMFLLGGNGVTRDMYLSAKLGERHLAAAELIRILIFQNIVRVRDTAPGDWSSCFTNGRAGEVLEEVKWEAAGRGL